MQLPWGYKKMNVFWLGRIKRDLNILSFINDLEHSILNRFQSVLSLYQGDSPVTQNWSKDTLVHTDAVKHLEQILCNVNIAQH